MSRSGTYDPKYGFVPDDDGEMPIEVLPMTNGDRIRAMTDEKLAVSLQNGCCRPDIADCPIVADCEKCWLDWLKQGAEDDGEREG